jgi:hypothetical protein
MRDGDSLFAGAMKHSFRIREERERAHVGVDDTPRRQKVLTARLIRLLR